MTSSVMRVTKAPIRSGLDMSQQWRNLFLVPATPCHRDRVLRRAWSQILKRRCPVTSRINPCCRDAILSGHPKFV